MLHLEIMDEHILTRIQLTTTTITDISVGRQTKYYTHTHYAVQPS